MTRSADPSISASGDLVFTVDARHIQQLGRELVGDRVTAVSELIKNAYDADATRVTISFDLHATPTVLELGDDGVGMTLNDVRDGWMRVSTDLKERSPKSPVFGRDRAGRKGIGRFAAETLGRRLMLRTKAASSDQAVVVDFNWADDFKPGLDLSSVRNRFRTEGAALGEHWTKLRIEGLHDPWSYVDRQRVLQSILLLQPPFPIAPVATTATARRGTLQPIDPGFRVELSADGAIETVEGFGVDGFIRAATAVIDGDVDADGRGHWRVRSDQLVLEDSQHDERTWLTGPMQFRAAYFVYSADAIGSVSVREAREMGNRYGGIRLYRDGLRILPYGEPTDDWLGLNAAYRRRVVLVPLGNINFFGQVLVTRGKNQALVDTASREGVLQGPEFQDLREFVSQGLIWGAQRVAGVRRRKIVTGTSKKRPTRGELIDQLKSAVAATLSTDPELSAAVTQRISAILDETRAEAGASDRAERDEMASLVDELNLLRVLASLGTSIAVFSHEVKHVVIQARASLDDLTEAIGPRRLDPLVDRVMGELAEALESLEGLGAYLEEYSSDSGRRERTNQSLAEVLPAFVAAFRQVLNRRGIAITTVVTPTYLRSPEMSRSELVALLFNLVTNAVRAVDREGWANRRIAVSATQRGDVVDLRVQDTGTGIDPMISDRVFDAFVTTSTPGDPAVGVGTGLGLKIVRDIAEANGGSAAISEADEGYVTSFTVSLPLK